MNDTTTIEKIIMAGMFLIILIIIVLTILELNKPKVSPPMPPTEEEIQSEIDSSGFFEIPNATPETPSLPQAGFPPRDYQFNK